MLNLQTIVFSRTPRGGMVLDIELNELATPVLNTQWFGWITDQHLQCRTCANSRDEPKQTFLEAPKKLSRKFQPHYREKSKQVPEIILRKQFTRHTSELLFARISWIVWECIVVLLSTGKCIEQKFLSNGFAVWQPYTNHKNIHISLQQSWLVQERTVMVFSGVSGLCWIFGLEFFFRLYKRLSHFSMSATDVRFKFCVYHPNLGKRWGLQLQPFFLVRG